MTRQHSAPIVQHMKSPISEERSTMTVATPTARHITREEARATLEHKVEQYRRAVAHNWTATLDPRVILADAEWRLRWIDCAPDGANHQVAPLQDKTGTPMGGVYDENIGPCKALRESMDQRRGYAGAWLDAKLEQHRARMGAGDGTGLERPRDW